MLGWGGVGGWRDGGGVGGCHEEAVCRRSCGGQAGAVQSVEHVCLNSWRSNPEDWAQERPPCWAQSPGALVSQLPGNPCRPHRCSHAQASTPSRQPPKSRAWLCAR